MLNKLDQERVTKAIENILKEAGYRKIVSIGFEKFGIHDGDIIAISDLDRQRVFNFIVKNDVIYIKNRTTGQTLFEKFISSYQKPFSFTINK